MAGLALSVKEQLRVAQDENSPQEELLLIWNNSKSVKVRKAVASNPNAGAEVLRAAARLYLEEVLGNPGFAMLELFDEDQWVRRLSQAYSDPDKYIMENGGLYYNSRVYPNDHFCWAILLSSQLRCWTMDRVVQAMSAAAFRRAIKNTEVRSKLCSIYESELRNATSSWPFSLATLLILHKEGVISGELLYEGLSNFGAGSASAQKSVFTKYINSIHDMYRSTDDTSQRSFAAKLLAKSFLISRSHALHWLYVGHSELMHWGGELYTETLKHMEKNPGVRKSLVSDNIRTVGAYVASYIKSRFLSNAKTPDSITAAYEYIKAHGLLDSKFSRFGLMLSLKDDARVLAKCPIEVKDFFCRAGCLGSWASAAGTDPKYLIINEVNEHAYLTSGVDNLLFDKCSIRKVVSLDDSTYVF